MLCFYVSYFDLDQMYGPKYLSECFPNEVLLLYVSWNVKISISKNILGGFGFEQFKYCTREKLIHCHHHHHHHLVAVAEISPTILHQTDIFPMSAVRSSTFIPVSLEMVSGKVSFLPVEAFQRRLSDMISGDLTYY